MGYVELIAKKAKEQPITNQITVDPILMECKVLMITNTNVIYA